MNINIKGWEVRPTQCESCPFLEREDGRGWQNIELASLVITRNLNGFTEQICHHPRLQGEPETHRCKGFAEWKAACTRRL